MKVIFLIVLFSVGGEWKFHPQAMPTQQPDMLTCIENQGQLEANLAQLDGLPEHETACLEFEQGPGAGGRAVQEFIETIPTGEPT